MTDPSREQRLNQTFVRLADTLVEDYDVVNMLHVLVEECADLFDTNAGGLMLADKQGDLHLVASTSESAELVEIMQLNAGAGPCVECFHTGVAVSVPDIDLTHDRWPQFSRVAAGQGYRSMYATPLRLRGRTLGAMNLFSTQVGALNERDVTAARALADVATIGIVQERVIREGNIVATQLQHALDSRVVIEQAKGVLYEIRGYDMDEAFNALRRYARSHNLSLRSVAAAIISKRLDPSELQSAPVPHKRPVS
ncbi:ANTAR domain-containing protein [Marisediminicola sp. LYQ134]|uniref:ANTAR domain-containing protein n=1 Tax=unclassified Marisediminicola TaxID=2618316 RepID=UPI00398373F0